MDLRAQPKDGRWLGFIWGIAEASVFFVVPDVLLSWTALSSTRRAARQALFATAGAVLGGALLFTFAVRDPSAAERTVLAVPFVSHAMLDTASDDLAKAGLWGLVRGSGKGVPYKLYAVSAAPRASLAAFVAASVPARLWRFLAAVLLTSGIAHWSARRGVHLRTLQRIHLVGWALFYAWYWSQIR
jgi:membrane protein YqaA with SNARE-associated domain